MVLNTIAENLNPPKNRREQLKEIDGTPSYTENVPEIESNGHFIINFESHPQYGKWTPLNMLVIDNTSTSDLEVQINQNDDQSILVPSNNSKTISRDGIRQIKILEKSGNVVDSNEVQLTFTRNAVTSDEVMRSKKKTILNLR